MKHFITLLMAISFICIGVLLERYEIPKQSFDKLTGKKEVRQNLSQNYNIPASDDLIKAFGQPEQYMPLEEEYLGETAPEALSKSGKSLNLKEYDYYPLYQEAVNYLTSNELKEQANTLYKKLWAFDGTIDELVALKEKRKIELAMALGLNERYPGGELLNESVAETNSEYLIKEMSLRSRIPEMTVPLYYGESTKDPHFAVVIALHGNNSNPKKVMGFGVEDYSRKFGRKLVKQGYTVFAPYTYNLSEQNKHLSSLGMIYSGETYLTLDIQKLKALVDYIKGHDSLSDLPIICYGVGEGGKLAALFGALDDRVNMVISSGSMTNWQSNLENKFSSLENNPINTEDVIYNIPLLHEFTFSDLGRLISPRPFIIEAGSYDESTKADGVREWRRIKQWYDRIGYPNRAKLVWFQGYKEAVPELTEPIIRELLN